MNIIYISEVCSKTGIWLLKKVLPKIYKKFKPDFIIVNGNSATASGGLGKKHAGYMKKLGVSCITLGDNAFQRADLASDLNYINYVLRPANLPHTSPGKGLKIFFSQESPNLKLGVISILGTFGTHRLHAENPFARLHEMIKQIKKETPFIFLDFASFSSAEKQIAGFFLDGKITAVIGSGSKVPTSDEKILPKGTAFITDSGRTGSFLSVAGYKPANKIKEYMTGLPEYVAESWERPVLQGVNIIANENGLATSIERIFIEEKKCKEEA